jgi:hypothetical protein
MQYPTGALKDKRKPDALVRFYVPKVAVAPRQIDWVKYAPMAFDQDSRQKCVGAAFAELMAYDAAGAGEIPAGLPLYFSTWWIYNWARWMRGWLNEDCGSYPEDAATAICEHGLMPYTLWPCKRDEFGTIAMDTADPQTKGGAIMFPNTNKARIDNGVEGLTLALAEGPVSIAVPWFDKWGSSYKSGVLPPIADQEASGRHCIVFDGHDMDKGMFYGPNSWGKWGIQESALGERASRCGFAMPFEYIELFKSKFGGYDAWDIDHDKVPPLPEMKFKLIAHYAGGEIDLSVPAGNQASLYAGKKSGYEFSRWRPGNNINNPYSADTFITMLDDAEVSAFFKANKAKRCDLFAWAKLLNKAQGI